MFCRLAIQRGCAQYRDTIAFHSIGRCMTPRKKTEPPASLSASLYKDDAHSLRGLPTRLTKRSATKSNNPLRKVSCLSTSTSDALAQNYPSDISGSFWL